MISSWIFFWLVGGEVSGSQHHQPSDSNWSEILHAFRQYAMNRTSSTWWGFQYLQNSSKIPCVYPLRGNQDPAPRLHYCFLTAPPLSLHPLPSLISNCLNLPFGTQERSGRLDEAYFLQTRNRGHRKASVPRSLQGSWTVKKQTVSSAPQAPWSSPSIYYKLLLKGNHEPDFLHTTAYFGLTCVLSIKNCLKWILVVQS